jgi:hypothetical protein
MAEGSAIKTALGVLHLPASLRRVRSEPLPPDVDTLLRIAAGDEDLVADVALRTERPPAVIREAAVFYIEQVLLTPGSDIYRVLGASPEASTQDLRRNMALLMSWLHPDKDLAGDRAVLAARVTAAWNDIRNPNRRAAYDAAVEAAHAKARSLRSKAAPGGHRTGSAVALRAPSRGQPGTRQDGRRLGAHDNILRRCWRLVRRALRPRVTPS